MSTRRNVIIGATCLAGAAAGYGVKPRRHLSLLGQAKLADIVPAQFRGWTSRDVGDLVAPATAGSVLADLYSQTVERVYQHGGVGPEVMMLLAYGKTQSNLLQLHRPEVCYPAFGFRLIEIAITPIQLGAATTIEGRQLIAQSQSSDHFESILYWTRLGDFLPVTGEQQRLDRLKLALHGVIADGLLSRFSIAGADTDSALATLRRFIPNLIASIASIAPAALPALVGTAASKTLT